MQRYVDIHHHFLYQVDDGPKTQEEMMRMLDAAAAEGIGCMAATPHIHPGMAAFDWAQYQRSFQQAQQYVQQAGLPLLLFPGAEVYYTTMTPAMLYRNEIPRLGNGHYVLVEFHPHVSLDGICRAAVHIANTGSTMVLAHGERYRCLRFGDGMNHLRQNHRILIQLNAETLLNPGNFLMRKWVSRAMANEWIDVVASDAHDTRHRPCLMGQCAAYLEKNWGRETAERLCCLAPKKILQG